MITIEEITEAITEAIAAPKSIALAADVERYKGELIYANNLLELSQERICALETQLKLREEEVKWSREKLGSSVPILTEK